MTALRGRPRPWALTVAAVAAILASGMVAMDSVARAPTGGGTGGVSLDRIATVQDAVYAESAPGRRNARLLFVATRPGVIHVIKRGKLRKRPFLDISNRVNSSGPGAGLLSIEFAPHYSRSRLFYVFYTKTSGRIRVAQFKRSRRDRLKARRKSGREVIEIPTPASDFHNGGQVSFGPDGRLWLATGDGGPACDPAENAQNLDSLLGKVLRIVPERRGGYRVPVDNPFVGRDGRDEIYALGLRNPFRFSFDRVTGDMTLSDVGQARWEEINHESLGGLRAANFGWDAYEGSAPLDIPATDDLRCDESAATPAAHRPPIHEYFHSRGRCSITGGLVVRDRSLPSLYGRYLYADFCQGRLRTLIASAEGATDDRSVGIRVKNPTSFTEGRRGRVHVTSLAGGVYRLVGVADDDAGR